MENLLLQTPDFAESLGCNSLSEWKLCKTAVGGEKNPTISIQRGRSVSLEQQDVFRKHEATTAVGDMKRCIKTFHFIIAEME